MPRKLTTTDPNATASIRVEVPGWLKNKVVEVLEDQGKSLSDWVKDQMRALVDTHAKKPGKKH